MHQGWIYCTSRKEENPTERGLCKAAITVSALAGSSPPGAAAGALWATWSRCSGTGSGSVSPRASPFSHPQVFRGEPWSCPRISLAPASACLGGRGSGWGRLQRARGAVSLTPTQRARAGVSRGGGQLTAHWLQTGR